MDNLKINMTFECLTWRQPVISHLIKKCIETAKEGCDNVEFCAVDATRAEKDFLKKAVKVAEEAGYVPVK